LPSARATARDRLSGIQAKCRIPGSIVLMIFPEPASRILTGAGIKQSLIARTLAVRKKCPILFTEGQYLPLEVTGEHAGRIVAFARRARGSIAITVVPRTASRLLQAGAIRFEPAKWGDTAIALQQQEMPLIDAFCFAPCAANGQFAVAKLFEKQPFALLVSSDIAG
jgi:(1->4)-alpha-D-glucan 1-alpha-D-glucosylmutase